MAYIKKENISDRSKVKTTIKHSSLSGTFEVGTEVTIIGHSQRGYNIEDNYGNKMYEIGWTV